jgi:dTDP-4-amino-4,6-dideoxygalactose transaminase
MLRRQLPVHSPLPFSAVGRGVAALIPGLAPGVREAVAGELRRTYGARQLVLTDSGTSALTLALWAVLRQHPGRPVALPAYCCYDLVTAANGAQAAVALYDVDPHTLGPDWDSLTAVVRSGVSAVVVAHLYGIPVDLTGVARIAAESGAVLIEDAAQGAGAVLGGRPLGSFGSLSLLSFGRGKGITAGRGGALLAHDEAGQGMLQSVRDQVSGPSRGAKEVVALAAQWMLGRPSLYGIPAAIPWLGLGETVYREPRAPRVMSRAAAAVLATTLPLAVAEAEARRRNATRLLRAAAEAGLATVRPPAESIPGYLRLPLVVGSARRPAPRLGVMPAYPRTLAALDRFAGGWVNRGGAFPGATRLVEGLVTLPTHGGLVERDLQDLEGWLA